MSTTPDTLTARMPDRNLALAGEHLQALLDNPDLLEEIPEGATVISVPDDDVALAQYNLALALHAFARGANVYLRHARGVPTATATDGH